MKRKFLLGLVLTTLLSGCGSSEIKKEDFSTILSDLKMCENVSAKHTHIAYNKKGESVSTVQTILLDEEKQYISLEVPEVFPEDIIHNAASSWERYVIYDKEDLKDKRAQYKESIVSDKFAGSRIMVDAESYHKTSNDSEFRKEGIKYYSIENVFPTFFIERYLLNLSFDNFSYDADSKSYLFKESEHFEYTMKFNNGKISNFNQKRISDGVVEYENNFDYYDYGKTKVKVPNNLITE